MKNIFEDMEALKPVLKEIITLDDDRVIRLFEYIVVNKDIKKDEFKELIIEMKGAETMPTLAQRWLDEGKAEGIQIGMQRGIETGMQRGMQTGIFETAIVMIKDFQIAIDDVVAKLNIKKEELLEYMKKKSV